MRIVLRRALAAGVVLVAAGGVLAGDRGDDGSPVENELLKFVPSDPSIGKVYGDAVAMFGGRAVVGATGDGEAASNAGAAYVVDLADGSQVAKLLPMDLGSGDNFGTSIAMNGDWIVVGSRRDDDAGNNAGAVYVFDAQTLAQVRKLTPSTVGSELNYGVSVDLSGDLLVVGARFDSEVDDRAGAAYVYDLTTGAELHKLTAPDGNRLDQFGTAVAIDGVSDLIVVGMPGDDDNGSFSGSAYVYVASTGVFVRKILPTDASTGAGFGDAVDLEGSTAAIGSTGDDEGGPDFGSVYLYDAVSGAVLGKCLAEDGGSFENFGDEVKVSDGVVMTGAFNANDAGFGSGVAYLFDASTGDQIAKLRASDTGGNDRLGFAVAIDGDRCVAMAANDGDLEPSSGSGYVFAVGGGGAPCAGDADGSGAVDLADLNLVLGNFGGPASGAPGADFDGSGVIDLPDLNAVLGAFGAVCP